MLNKAELRLEVFLQNMVLIDLKNILREQFFLIMIDIYVDRINLAEDLVDLGMALRYDGGRKKYSLV